MKNTSVTPKTTFDVTPSPNHTAKIGASITRGMAFIALIKRKPSGRHAYRPLGTTRPSAFRSRAFDWRHRHISRRKPRLHRTSHTAIDATGARALNAGYTRRLSFFCFAHSP